MERANRYLLIAGLLLSSLAAGRIALERLRVEGRNRSVELVMEYPEVAALAAAEGKTVAEWLRALPVPLSVALTEGTLQEWGMRSVASTGPIYLLDAERYRQAKAALALKTRVELKPPAQLPYTTVQSTDGGRFAVVGDPDWVAQLGLGLNPWQLREVQAGGARPVARLYNLPGVNEFIIRGTLQQTHQQGATLLIFAGEQVLGYRHAIDAMAAAIRTFGMRYGAVEFGKQAGDSKLGALIPERTVRVHSISASEAVQMTPEELVERFERAAQERNIRVLYLRWGAGDTPRLQAFLQALVRALQRSGLVVQANGARPFQPLEPPLWLFPFIGLGVGILTGWVLYQLWAGGSPDQGTTTAIGWLPALMGLGLGLLCLLPEGRKLAALLAAILFPTVGLMLLPAYPSPVPSPQRGEGSGGTSPQRGEGGEWDSPRWGVGSVLQWANLLIFPFGWSLMGALHIVGLLAGTAFLVKADQFVGIKVAHVLPLLLVGAFYAAYATGRWDFWRRWLYQPVFWWQAGIALVVLLALVLMLVRTGNEAPGAVSDIELRFRALLESIMNVRPRTKEFLVGHPALVIAIALLMRRAYAWLPLMMLLAAVGQVSVVNTFCHLHSPLVVSLARVGWGALLGVALGFILLALAHWLNTRAGWGPPPARRR